MTTTAVTSASATAASEKPWMVPGAWIAAVGGALALAATNTVVALTWNDVESTADVVQLAADNPGAFQAEIGLGLLTAALLVPGIWAIAARLARRSPVFAALGGWFLGTGYVFGLVLSIESTVLLAVAQSGGDPATVVDALDNHTPVTSLATYVVFGLGALIGSIIIGVAMLRQKGALPVWVGVLMIASPVVRMAGLIAGISFAPTIASLMIAAAFAATLVAFRPAQNL